MEELSQDKRQRLKSIGLHFCNYYENIVRYNKKFCAECPHCTYPR